MNKETNKLLLQQKSQLQEDLDMLDNRIYKAIEILSNEINKCNSALTNPEYTICGKHELLKQEKKELIKVLKILKGDSNE